MELRKKIVIKEMSPLAGHNVLTLETEEQVRESITTEKNSLMVMVLPDGRTCTDPNRLLEMVQEDVYKGLESIEVYRLPILVGG